MPVPRPPRYKYGGRMSAAQNQVVTINGSNQGVFSFGKTFRVAPVVVASGGNGETVSIVAVTTTGFTATFRYQDSGALIAAGGNVRCLWIAEEPH
jgi:hypothetical protein